MAEQRQIDSLRSQLGNARTETAEAVSALKMELDVPRRLKANFIRNRTAWLGGAAIVGLLFSKIPARTSRVVVKTRGSEKAAVDRAGKAAVGLTLLKFALDLAKPALMRWFMTRFVRGNG